MSLVIVKTVAEQPMTDANLEEMDRLGLPCLQAHGVTWRYSLLSCDRCQMICTFDAPDAGSVRNAYAKLGVRKRAIWAGELIQPEGALPHSAERSVIEVQFLSETDWNEVQQALSQCCRALGMNWLRSYLSLDRTRVVYELDGSAVESFQEVHHKLGLPQDNSIWSAQLLQP
jgi:hypothetical protein